MFSILSKLDKIYKIKFIFLYILIILTIIFESISFTALIPFFNFLLMPYEDLLSKFPVLTVYINFFDINEKKDLIFISTLTISFVFFLKFLLVSFYYFYESKLLYDLQYSLSQETYKKILNLNYINFKSYHSSEIVRNITAEVNACVGIFNSLSILSVEISISLLLISLIFILDQTIVIPSILFICLISFMYVLILKKKLVLWGTERQNIESLRIKLIYEGVDGIKELKSYHLENFFLKFFSKVNKSYSLINKKQYLVSQFPRIILEFILILFICSLLIMMFLSGDDINDIIVTLGVIGVFSFRILPSANKIITNYQNVKFFKPSVQTINQILNTTNSENLNDDIIISHYDIKSLKFENVSYFYNKNKIILKNINFEIKKDEHIGIYGESGVGKTTLLDILLGLIKPVSGNILINNVNSNLDNSYYKKIISYVPQKQFLINDTILNNIIFGYQTSKKLNLTKLNIILKQTNLINLVNSLDDGLETIISESGSNLSAGQLQRIVIARALYRSPKILFLDEPTSALDVDNELLIIDTIKNLKKSGIIVVAISHNKNFFKFFDKIYLISDSKIKVKPSI